jgi:hypothetical protein
VLSAAASSPGAVHRLPTLQDQWLHTLLVGSSAHDLAGHLAEAEARNPMIGATEDWWPSDPRMMVTFKYRGRRWRIHPGRHVAPIDVLETLVDAADATGEQAMKALGFSGGDLIELALALMHGQVTRLAAAWPTHDRLGPTLDPVVQATPDSFGAQVRATPVRVSDAEVEVARRQLVLDELLTSASATRRPHQVALAAAWATHSPDSPTHTVSPDASLAVTTQHHRWAVPAGLVLAHLQEGIQLLCERVADADSYRRLHGSAKRRAHTLLMAQTFTLDAQRRSAPKPGAGAAVEAPRSGRSRTRQQPEQVKTSRYETWDDDEWKHPDAVLKFGRRLVTVDVVPLLDERTADAALAKAHEKAMARSVEDVLSGLQVPTSSDSVVLLRLLLTHGTVQVTAVHAGGFALLTLPVLRRILRDCDASDTGRDQLCQFIEDLNILPEDLDDVLPAESDDLWTHWQRHGGLVPASAGRIESHSTLLVAPTLYDTQWEKTAALEPFAALADAAGLGQLATLPTVVAAHDQLTIIGPGGTETAYLTAPDTVVTTATEASTDMVAAHAIAAALSKALHSSGLSAAAADRHGVYQLHVTISGDDRAWLAGSVEDGWIIGVAEPMLRSIVTDPGAFHTSLGSALATPLEYRKGVAEALRCWEEMPPAVILGLHASPSRGHTFTKVVIASRASATRAARQITAQLPEDLPAGLYTGGDAGELVRSVLYPATMRTLHRAITPLNAGKAVRAALAAADAAHQERAQRRQALEIALSTADADAYRAEVLSRPDDASLTRGLELLVEQLLAAPGDGRRGLDRYDVADLTAVCDAALLLTIGADHARRGSGELRIHVNDRGGVNATVLGAPSADNDTSGTKDAAQGGANALNALPIDAEAWLAATRTGIISRDRPPPELPEEHDGMFRQLLTGRHTPKRLVQLDDTMRRHLGCGIEAIIAVLATAAGWPDDVDLPDTTADALTQATAEWAQQIPQGEIEAAIRRLTLHGAAVKADTSIWEQERRAHRLLLRPLVAVDDRLLIPRHICQALQEVTADFIADGRVPWPDVPKAVTQAANDLRGIATKSLERFAADEASGTGLPTVANVEQHEAAAAEIEGLTGELDILVAHPERQILWVVEAKDHIMTASGYSISKRVQRFAGRTGHEAKLLKKAETIRQHARAAAALLGVATPGASAWEVRAVMATRRIEPAAFTLRPPAVEYVLVDDLAEHLTGNDRRYGRSN